MLLFYHFINVLSYEINEHSSFRKHEIVLKLAERCDKHIFENAIIIFSFTYNLYFIGAPRDRILIQLDRDDGIFGMNKFY